MAKKRYKNMRGHTYETGSTINSIMSGAGTGLSVLSNAFKKMEGIDTKPYIDQANIYGNQVINASDNQSLLDVWSENSLNHMNKYDITGRSEAEDVLGGIGSALSAFGAGYSVGGVASPYVGLATGAITSLTDIAGSLIGGLNTRENINNLNKAIDAANDRREMSLVNAATNIKKRKQSNMLTNMLAFGGPVYGFPMGDGAIEYDLAKDALYTKEMRALNKANNAPLLTTYEFSSGGDIHIKPSKRGTFTAAATKHNKSVQEFASQVLANPDNYSPAMVKKANFARNAAKWHSNGGPLMSNEFTNGVTMINQGGTHENNPHEGVQIGIAPDGKPNLVEEGEAIYNDYVFSNRLKVPKEVRNKYKLRGPKDMTFAEAFRQAQEESEERPNDPISQDGLENIAMVLARTQEAIRGYESNKKSEGGHLFSGLENPYSFIPVEEEEVKDPEETRKAIEDFWRSKFGDYWDSPGVKNVYLNTPESGNLAKPWEKDTNGVKNRNLSMLRHADTLANIAAVSSDLFGLTNTPTTFNYIPAFQSVGYTPLGNYIPVTHYDTRYEANRRAQQAAATRNAIMNSSSPSRWANLLAADYNAQIAEGEALRQGAMQDYERMIQREQFNRATNQANSELGLKTSIANQDARIKYAQAALHQAKMNEDNSNAASAARAANLSALAESIANMGRESDAISWRDMLISSGAFGTLSEKPSNWTNAEWREYQKATGAIKACGGKIKRKKKGLTY